MPALLVCCGVTCLRDYHLFQLNSYRAGAQLRGLARGFAREYLLRHAAAFAVLAVTAAALPRAVAAPFAVLAYAVQTYFNRPRKAKKPLVYTPRVKRMLAVHGLLVALVTLAAGSFSAGGRDFCLAFLLPASPFFVLLANGLNAPVEKALNRRYIRDAERRLRAMPGLAVIGVTGSYGKTSTKYFLHALLSSRYNVLMTPESFNTTLGVVKAVRTRLRPVHEVFVCEMGARNAGDIEEICGIVRPRHGVITAIGPQHLESFKSLENIVKTKFELADALPEGGLLFLNGDDEILRSRARGADVVYSASDGVPRSEGAPRPGGAPNSDAPRCRAPDYAARDIRVSERGSSFSVVFPDGEERRFETPLLGRHNVQNILAAVAVSDRLGVGRGDMAASAARLAPVPHRLQLIRRNSVILIDDSYNSNQSGARAALETLAMFEGLKILVTPGMVELGAAEDESNRRFGSEAAAVCDRIVLMGERQTRSVREGLKLAGFPDEKTEVAESLEQAFERIEKFSLEGFGRKVVLLENDLPDNY
ncbi:MAG: UDP-N-acetylmuramoyl-tripeptide--D-alanyl-D-alanine ligase [Synergistaceae bacterium]|nr:UDP-N-acetylmuramoyl-tripeptide--D-alanyl-D-alanine ligase [Synergistaceae bacterium]